MSSNQQVAQKGSQEVSQSQGDSSYLKKTTETISSIGASAAGAFSGGLSLGGSASSKQTTTTKSSGSQISRAEADTQYEENIEQEYAKREGGA